MKISTCKLHKMFQIKIFKAFLLVSILVAGAWAQGKSSSVFIAGKGEKGTDAEAAASALANQIGIGLQDNYPCIDSLTDKEAAALLDWERRRELLTGELDEEKLQALAGAVGARYLVSVSAQTLPNGQTSLSAVVIDTNTGRVIARRSSLPADGKAVLNNVDAIAQQIMQDLSGVFNQQCEPRWTGTVTRTYKRFWEESESKNEKSASMGGKDYKAEKKSTYYLEHSIVVRLMASPSDRENEGKITASVRHSFEYRLEETSSGTWSQWCRAPGVPGHWKPASGNYQGTEQESGNDTATVEGYLFVSKERGSFEFRVPAPDLKTKWTKQEHGVKGGCESEPFSNSETKDGGDYIYRQFTKDVALEIWEKFDPRNPDVISGSKTGGSLEDGQTTITWNLRLIKPKKK